MQTFDQHLADLVRAGEVAYEVALAAATRPADFALQFRMLHASGPGAGGVAVRATAQPARSTPTGETAPATSLHTGGDFDFLNGV
jgi:hypothetical protein